MNSSFYEKVFQFSKKRLTDTYLKQNGVLEVGDIDNEITKIRKIIESEFKTEIFGQDGNFSDSDYKRLQDDLEKYFNVRMNTGLVIKGDEQKQRNTSWYSINTKANNNNFYWDRLEEFYKGFLSPQVIRTLDDDTDMIMNQIGDPRENKFGIYGMVVGHVQSGKTSNYASLICKAADMGYKFIVVVAGDKNNLRNQTQVRINEAFVGKNDIKEVGVGLNDLQNANKMQPISLTTEESDFNRKDAHKNSQGINFDNINTPVLLVIKKNANTLFNVIKWIKSHYKGKISQHAMLLIDDESDYASINTKEENNPTAINKNIRVLLELFEKSSYVAYTATPYANIFIDHTIEDEQSVKIEDADEWISKDLFPRDFIYSLDAPSNYFGAEKIFIENPEKFLVNIDDYNECIPLKHKKDHCITRLPNSLFEAINIFMLNVAIRDLMGQINHNSMLVNISRFSDMHKNIVYLIDEYLKAFKKDINSYILLSNSTEQSNFISNLKSIFETKFNIEFSWQDISKKLSEIANSILVIGVYQNASNNKPLDYNTGERINVIAVGGLSLSRGFTLEGLSVSYFIRSTIFYDTLMQMGRWFGYRQGYEDLCKIYMPEDIQNYFRFIIEATNELMYKFKDMAEDGLTPYNFGLAVRQDPNSHLQITAKNKMKHAEERYTSLDLSGKLIETVRFAKNPQLHNRNLTTLKNFIGSLDKSNKKGKAIIYKNIDKSEILNFINNFEVIKDNNMQLDFVKTYLEEKNALWDVVLYGGKGEFAEGFEINMEERLKLQDKGKYIELGNRKLSSGDPEKALLDDEIYEQSKKEKRGNRSSFLRKKLKNPVLMLHLLDVKSNQIGFESSLLPAYGICFPNVGVDSNSQTIKYLINKVYQDEILLEINESEEQDD
ncbi:Z1 domain-containing protein [Campylobacter gastrosuis]|uniref:Z1 domain-containing protein n=1 Tax=Campylobacter gastrosuis TaxID=2974576 RepID=A0ABT7HS25_9BACT|nr:Z1 domain-containing protein [Campylobacter gastrosuis]MDL0089680.1 Z1 domain-containing protein [Campylobacter gastrosuis]